MPLAQSTNSHFSTNETAPASYTHEGRAFGSADEEMQFFSRVIEQGMAEVSCIFLVYCTAMSYILFTRMQSVEYRESISRIRAALPDVQNYSGIELSDVPSQAASGMTSPFHGGSQQHAFVAAGQSILPAESSQILSTQSPQHRSDNTAVATTLTPAERMYAALRAGTQDRPRLKSEVANVYKSHLFFVAERIWNQEKSAYKPYSFMVSSILGKFGRLSPPTQYGQVAMEPSLVRRCHSAAAHKVYEWGRHLTDGSCYYGLHYELSVVENFQHDLLHSSLHIVPGTWYVSDVTNVLRHSIENALTGEARYRDCPFLQCSRTLRTQQSPLASLLPVAFLSARRPMVYSPSRMADCLH